MENHYVLTKENPLADASAERTSVCVRHKMRDSSLCNERRLRGRGWGVGREG